MDSIYVYLFRNELLLIRVKIVSAIYVVLWLGLVELGLGRWLRLGLVSY